MAAAKKTRRTARPGAGAKRKAAPAKRKWSGAVTQHSDALDLEQNVFTWRDPKRIARSLKQSAEHSRRRKAGSYQSAMSMLTFYINRGGRNLSAAQKRILGQAKDELRLLFGRE
jgi:hypothetical protein